MKKFTALQLLLGMGFITGTLSLDAYGSSDKYAKQAERKKEKEKKRYPQAKSDDKAKKQCQENMKSIEAQLRKIKRQFQKDHNASQALEQLKALEPKIKSVIANMKKNEQHGKMYEVHEHTLQRKLKKVREYVKSHTKA